MYASDLSLIRFHLGDRLGNILLFFFASQQRTCNPPAQAANYRNKPWHGHLIAHMGGTMLHDEVVFLLIIVKPKKFVLELGSVVPPCGGVVRVWQPLACHKVSRHSH
jgi:hypothetical protein